MPPVSDGGVVAQRFERMNINILLEFLRADLETPRFQAGQVSSLADNR